MEVKKLYTAGREGSTPTLTCGSESSKGATGSGSMVPSSASTNATPKKRKQTEEAMEAPPDDPGDLAPPTARRRMGKRASVSIYEKREVVRCIGSKT